MSEPSCQDLARTLTDTQWKQALTNLNENGNWGKHIRSHRKVWRWEDQGWRISKNPGTSGKLKSRNDTEVIQWEEPRAPRPLLVCPPNVPVTFSHQLKEKARLPESTWHIPMLSRAVESGHQAPLATVVGNGLHYPPRTHPTVESFKTRNQEMLIGSTTPQTRTNITIKIK